MRKIGAIILVILLLASLALVGCGKKDQANSGGNSPYKIGVLTTLSGDTGFLGLDIKDSIDLEVEKINSEGGVNGHPIEIVYQDDGFDSAKAVSGFDKLAQQDKVLAVFGLIGEPLEASVRPLAEKYKIPLVMNVPSVPGTRDISPKWNFSAAQNEVQDVELWIQWCKDNGYTKVAFLQTNDALNEARLGEAKVKLPAAGIELNILTDQINFTSVDVTPEVTKLKALVDSTGSQAVLMTVWPNLIPSVLKAAKAINLNVPFTQYCEGGDSSLLAMGGDELEGYQQMGFKLLAGSALPDNDPQKAVCVDFATRFYDKYGRIAGVENSWSRDALYMIVEGLKISGADSSKLRDAIEGITGFIGTSGIYNFSPTQHDGLGADSMGWFVIIDHKFVMYKNNILVNGQIQSSDVAH
jgi:branched-chain amino acid transport system substrate-binding protein